MKLRKQGKHFKQFHNSWGHFDVPCCNFMRWSINFHEGCVRIRLSWWVQITANYRVSQKSVQIQYFIVRVANFISQAFLGKNTKFLCSLDWKCPEFYKVYPKFICSWRPRVVFKPLSPYFLGRPVEARRESEDWVSGSHKPWTSVIKKWNENLSEQPGLQEREELCKAGLQIDLNSVMEHSHCFPIEKEKEQQQKILGPKLPQH